MLFLFSPSRNVAYRPIIPDGKYAFDRVQVELGLCKATLIKSLIVVLFAANVTALVGADSLPALAQTPVSLPPSAHLLSLPMQFEKNVGQTDGRVEFLSRGPGYALFLTPNQAVLSLMSMKGSTPQTSGDHGKHRGHRRSGQGQTSLQMNLIGANPNPVMEGISELPGSVSYFLGRKAGDWHVGVSAFEKVRYQEVYQGIDLVYYGNQRQLEYDFIVGAHADPARISLSFAGATQLEVDSNGDLIIQLPGAAVRWHKPVAYQPIAEGRQEVAARFVVKQPNQVGFEIGAYDPNRLLVIDPTLLYATFLGSSSDDYVSGIAVATNGTVYVVGDTLSLNFPTFSGYRSTSAGSNEVFVTKLNATGTALVYSTYIGGNGNDYAGGIAVDSNGNAYVVGTTDSLNFPTKNAAYSGNAGFNDVFVAKLGPFGTNLLYGSYLGGGGDESGNAIAVDNSGNAYIAGDTYSLGTGNGTFPTVPSPGAYQRQNGGGQDAIVAKFNTTLTGSASLVYSTFLGGQSGEKAYGIAVDSSSNAYVVGEVNAYPNFVPNPPTPPQSDFPVANAFQPVFNAGFTDPYLAGTKDGFVTKINGPGTALLFSTFLGGNDDDLATGITLDNTGKIYIIGETSSTNFPTLNAAQPTVAGAENGSPNPDAFITVFQNTGTSLYYSTFLGGSGFESGFAQFPFGIAVDIFGDIYVAGQTESFDDFPITLGTYQTNALGPSDAFVAKLNPAVPGPASLIYSTLLGGDGYDSASGIAVDQNGNFYIAGFTSSVTNLATANVYRGTNSGGNDAFIAKFSSPPDLSVVILASTNTVLVGSNISYTIKINNNGRSTFTGVTNFVQFSTNVTFLSVSPGLGNVRTNGAQLIFNIGTMTNNASLTETIVIATQVPGALTNTATLTSIETATLEPNKDNNVATLVLAVRGIADVTLAASAVPSSVLVSSNITYTLSVTNKGGNAATSVVLTDALPATLAFVSATSTQGTCANDNGVVTCNLGTLASNAAVIVTLIARATTNGVVTNVASVAAFELDVKPANNSVSMVTTMIPVADLSSSQTVPSSGYAGANFTYTLKVTNAGPSIASNPVVTDLLPPGASFLSATMTQGTYSQSNGIVSFALGSMGSNAVATLSITVKPMVSGILTNLVTVTNSSSGDPLPANNSSSATTMINPAADLAISQIASPLSTEVTSNVTFTVIVTNQGPSTVTGVVVSDALPSSFAIVSIQSPAGAACTQSNGVVTCNLGNMSNGASATLSLLARAGRDGIFTNTANVVSVTTNLNPNNNASVAVTVAPNPNAPLLKITRQGTNIILSWSTNAVGYTLQSSTNLWTTNSWTGMTNIPVKVGDQNMVTNALTGSTSFYRLIKSTTMLSAVQVGNSLVVSWPATGPLSGTLKTATNLSNPIIWSDVSADTVLVGSNYYVTNLFASENAFFRLFY